jgi:hypothetical protein
MQGGRRRFRPLISSSSSPDLIRGSPQPPESAGIPGSSPGMTMKRRALRPRSLCVEPLVLIRQSPA